MRDREKELFLEVEKDVEDLAYIKGCMSYHIEYETPRAQVLELIAKRLGYPYDA